MRGNPLRDQGVRHTVFDIFNLFFLVLAIVILLKLRNVLGRRTGHERPPFDRYSQSDAPAEDNVVTLPGAQQPGPTATASDTPPVSSPADWSDFAAPDSDLAKGLSAIRNADPSFEPRGFLDGAKLAYEMIVSSFAAGDRKTLRDLLSRTVFDGFSSAIEEREERGETMESTFVGIDSADLVDATLKGREAQVTVKFRSQLISATMDSDGEVVDGDPKQVREVVDIWTFERDTASRDPNWRLVATEAAH